jgi:hypothetical protein
VTLLFKKDEVIPLKTERPPRCQVCKERIAPWMTKLRKGEKAPVCGWCLLYSNETEWGYANRAELAHVGKGAEATAARAMRDLPVLDQRHRLSTDDAEKFVAGVFATSQALRGSLGRFIGKHGR